MLQGFFKYLGVVKLIDGLSPDSSLKQVPVNELLQNFCLKNGLRRGLLKARVEDLVMLGGQLKLASLLFKLKIISLNKVTSHL